MIEGIEIYQNVKLDNLIHIPEISFYNHNYYIGLKRQYKATNDLIFAKSDDDDITELFIAKPYEYSYFGYCSTSEGESIHLVID